MKIGPHEVAVTRRANCRRMILHCRKTDGALTLSVPKGMRDREIRAFLTANRAWMDSKTAAVRPWQPEYLPGERHWLLGRQVTLGENAPSGKAFVQYRADALSAVLDRLLHSWAPVMGVTVTHVTLREMTSRWGSCRPKTGRLTFNLALACYEERLIEETVVHEMCHFFHGDHSAAFYREMDRFLPDWRVRKAQRRNLDVRPLPPE